MVSIVQPLLGDIWFTEQASTVAADVDSLFYLVYWISLVFFVIIVAAMALFMVKYRRRVGIDSIRTATHNNALEITWSVIPTLLIVVIFVKGFGTYLNMRTPPAETYDITVVAQKWSWMFLYPNGGTSADLHVPAGVPVKLTMASEDVIHSLYIRDFRVKMDVVPGRYNVMWFEATRPDTYPLQCTEYCGTHHSDMNANVVVHAADEFEAFLEEQRAKRLAMPRLELGELLYTEQGCVSCHSLDGSKRVGPSFVETYGNSHQFSDGTSVTGDEEYIRESIEYPQAKIRAGYAGVMPTYKGRLALEELNALATFIKSKNPKYASEAERDSKQAEQAKKEADEAETNGEASDPVQPDERQSKEARPRPSDIANDSVFDAASRSV